MVNMDGAYRVQIKIPFPTERITEIVYHVLRVDAEPRRGGVEKELTINNNILKVELSGDSSKHLRVATNSIFESINLITETIEFTGEPVSDKYSHFVEI